MGVLRNVNVTGSVTQIDPLYKELGGRLRASRRHAKMSQEEVARRVGLTRTSITNIEHGRQQIQIHTLYAIAKVLGMRPALLLPDPQPSSADDISAVEAQLPANPAERDWVRRVLALDEV